MNFRWQIGVALAQSSGQTDGIRLDHPYVSICFDVMGSDGTLQSQSAELSIPQFQVCGLPMSYHSWAMLKHAHIFYCYYRNSKPSLKKSRYKWTMYERRHALHLIYYQRYACMPLIVIASLIGLGSQEYLSPQLWHTIQSVLETAPIFST